MADNKVVNIPSTIQDSNYRYKMPKMILKIEGKGNGIKTNITNLVDVATALDVDPEYILKFFGFEKASQTIYKENGKNDVSTIINGAFTDQDMIKVLDKFIEKYVCCPKCTYPQMHLKVKKNKVLGECDSCGFNGELDNVHKVAQLITKKPPKDRVVIGKKNANVAEIVELKNDKKDSKNKDKARKLAREDLELESQALNERLEILRGVFSEKMATEKDLDLIAAEMAVTLKSFNIDKTLTDRLAYLIFNSIFTINIAQQIQAYGKLYSLLLKKFHIGEPELETLLNFQYLFLVKNKDPALFKFIETIMSRLYDNNLIEEKSILKWDEGAIQSLDKHFLFLRERNEAFKMHCKEFLKWLQQDEEDEEQQATTQTSAEREVPKAVQHERNGKPAEQVKAPEGSSSC